VVKTSSREKVDTSGCGGGAGLGTYLLTGRILGPFLGPFLLSWNILMAALLDFETFSSVSPIVKEIHVRVKVIIIQ
jgi:hypothetical protein